jgi:hypothetical protein
MLSRCARSRRVIQIPAAASGAEVLLDDCSHPRHAALHLKVTPIGGCDGFEPAPL